VNGAGGARSGDCVAHAPLTRSIHGHKASQRNRFADSSENGKEERTLRMMKTENKGVIAEKMTNEFWTTRPNRFLGHVVCKTDITRKLCETEIVFQ